MEYQNFIETSLTEAAEIILAKTALTCVVDSIDGHQEDPSLN